MKKFNIKVNGKSYEVEVEEINYEKSINQTVQQAVPEQKPEYAAKTVENTGVEQAEKSIPVSESGEVIQAPMPGTILDIKVSEGQQVKSGDIILILEAMKMENEITAPKNGTVMKVYTSKGASVNTGEPLVSIG